MKLLISAQLTLPVDVVTSTIVVYGGKGMGKTVFGSVLCEELSRCGLRWSFLDPLGVAWGLRHSADGKGNGIECVILGGAHGDIPIEPTGGAVVADFVVDEPTSVIIDFSRKPSGEMWTVGEKVRFITDYAKRLFQRQGSLLNNRRREPLLQVLDEAARYIPQMIPHGNPQVAECVGAWETLVEEGRNIGIGVCLITQRSARMNKSVSEICDAMVAFRTIGPNSVGAVTDWLGAHISKDIIKKHVETLRSLDRGRCLIVSPGWLKFEDVVTIRNRETFDSSSTPKAGERPRRVAGEGAKPNLEKYVARMKETIERVKENDPKQLRVRIAELERQLKTAPTKTKVETKIVTDERAIARAVRPLRDLLGETMKLIVKVNAIGFEGTTIAPEEISKVLEATAKEIARQAKLGLERRSAEFERIKRDANRLLAQMKRVLDNEDLTVSVEAHHSLPVPARTTIVPMAPRTRPGPLVASNGDLSGPEAKILTALSQLLSIGKETPPKAMVAGWAGYSPEGGAFGNPIGALRSKGLVDYPSAGFVRITEDGLSKVGAQPAPDAGELKQRILNICTGPERKILEALMQCGTDAISKAELAARAGYSPVGGAFGNPVGALRSKGFLDYPSSGFVQAASWLFEVR